jgi:hypothetical protein
MFFNAGIDRMVGQLCPAMDLSLQMSVVCVCSYNLQVGTEDNYPVASLAFLGHYCIEISFLDRNMLCD